MKHHRVFVSGCYDMLHSGHVAFFREAAQFGDLYVGIGSDATIRVLKGRKTIYSEQERLYMVKSIRYVTDACINNGSGAIDFVSSVDYFQPDIFVVNEDGSSLEKETFCRQRGIEYVVLKRIPEEGLACRSTSMLRTVKSQLPTRLDLAGTWIDQPFVSKFHPGWAITISLEPTFDILERCGMSTSTRNVIKQIWPYQLPDYDPEMLARLAFCFENEPNKQDHVSGAQDSIGICVPGLCRHWYDGGYWPSRIETCYDEDILSWLEAHICMVMMFPRPIGTDVITGCVIDEGHVAALTAAADGCWNAILQMDLDKFAFYYRASFDAQTSMFPGMLSNGVPSYIDKYKSSALAWKMPGAGGGGYLALVCEDPSAFHDAFRIKIRRRGE